MLISFLISLQCCASNFENKVVIHYCINIPVGKNHIEANCVYMVGEGGRGQVKFIVNIV